VPKDGFHLVKLQDATYLRLHRRRRYVVYPSRLLYFVANNSSGGASGCVVASRLAHSPSKPSVLLLEAGGSNDSIDHLTGAERFKVAFSPNSPLNWGYKTVPQEQLSGQQIDYARGKGLGGSTAINFCGWVVGPRDDYDEWARLVQDENFNWRNARRCLDKIEKLDTRVPNAELKKYVHAKIVGMNICSFT
jgi:choline dehydrogenase-like flavoprotein